VGGGFVASLQRPGGDITGFGYVEAGMGGKWLQLLTEIAPGVRRAAIMFNPDTAPYGRLYFFPAFEAGARSLKVGPTAAVVHSDAEIETVIGSLGREPGGGLVVMPDPFTEVRRAPIIFLQPETMTAALAEEGAIDASDLGRLSHQVIEVLVRREQPRQALASVD
jgi:putative ABC transport system substrate-binding protein